MRKLILFLLSLALTSSVGAQSCCDAKGKKDIPGVGGFYFPGRGNIVDDSGNVLNTTLLLDATGEMAAMIGQLYIDGAPSAAKNCTAAGGCSIAWRAGTISGFAGSDDTVVIGLQDFSTSAGPPTQPDETFGVSATLAGDVDPPTTASWNTTDMEADGDDTTYTHGQQLGIVWNLSACNGCSMVVQGTTVNIGPSIPATALKTAGTWAVNSGNRPNAIITFDDGTLGWIDGTIPASAGTTATYNNTSTPDEIGICFTVPQRMEIDALYFAYIGAAASGDGEIILYAGANTASPVAEATVVTSYRHFLAASTTRLRVVTLTSKKILSPGVTYAVTYRPTSANNVTLNGHILGDASHAAVYGGTGSYACSRSDNAGTFSAVGSNIFYNIGVRVSGVFNN